MVSDSAGAADREGVIRALYARGHRGLDLGLDRVVAGARALGDPHAGLAVLHVAGTNGKGSTAAMLERVVREAGVRTGLYTSPHLVHLAERVRVGGAAIAREGLADALARVMSDAPAELTFFETLTLAALVAFRDAGVEVAVLEVGLGGRLDATNIVERPLATGVVSITEGEGGRYLEHEALLGATVDAIAREKAGIFKAGCPAVLGRVSAEANRAALEVANAAGASPVWVVEPDHPQGAATGGRVRHTFPDGTTLLLEPALRGAHQIDNAAVAAGMALACAPELGLTGDHITRGIARAEWPGRMESLRVGDVDVVLDCAHNLDGARALAKALAGHDADQTVLVFGALADKPYRPVLEVLARCAARRVYAAPEGRAPAPLEELVAIAPGETRPSPREAIDHALAVAVAGRSRATVLVTGSIYLVGAIRAHLLGITPDPVIAL